MNPIQIQIQIRSRKRGEKILTLQRDIISDQTRPDKQAAMEVSTFGETWKVYLFSTQLVKLLLFGFDY